jgi:hypothetical protein
VIDVTVYIHEGAGMDEPDLTYLEFVAVARAMSCEEKCLCKV